MSSPTGACCIAGPFGTSCGDLTARNCEERDGAHVPVGQALGTPALRVEAQAQDGTVLSSAVVHRGEWTSVGKHEIGFLDLRRWSSFRVTEDRVYPTVWLALWLAVGAMSLRYWPDLSTWFREGPPAVQGGDDGRTV